MAVLTSKLVVSLVDQITGPARGAAAALRGLNGYANKTTSALMGAGGGFSAGAIARNMLAIGAGYVGVRQGISGTVGAAIKFEEAFADVRKVVDGTPAQLAVLRHEILEMSKVIPTSAEGIAEIVAAAGQSNIPYQELGKFTEMVAKVAVAWDTSERETSESLAKIKTQLNFSTDQIGLYADAINHLSNNTAATAPNLVDFAKRVAAQGDMFGFTATQSLAFGGAMIAAGGETEVASTSFRNMGMALADAAKAPKRTQAAFKAIGLDAQKIGKAFHKNSVGTMLDVFERINKLPEHQRLSAAIGIFGREARALMPLINDTRELRRQLGLVGNETNYAGSAFEEFIIRADTTANVLQVLGNKFRAVGIGAGTGWLPTIKDFALGIGDVLDTLGKRIGVFDALQVSFSSFLTGLGGVEKGQVGGVRQLMNDIGDLLFGEVFEGDTTQADQRAVALAKLSNNYRNVGKNLRAFATDLGSGDILGAMSNLTEALGNMSGAATMFGALGIGATGAAMLALAGGITKLVLSPFGKIALVAIAVSELINAVKGADSIGEFVENLSKLGAFEWAAIAGGILMLVGPTLKLARAVRRLGSGAGLFGGSKAAPRSSTNNGRSGGGSTSTTGKRKPRKGKGGKGFVSPWETAKPNEPAAPRGPRSGPTGPRISSKPERVIGSDGLIRRGVGTVLNMALLTFDEVLTDVFARNGDERIEVMRQNQESWGGLEQSVEQSHFGQWWNSFSKAGREFLLGDMAKEGFSLKDSLAINTNISRKNAGTDVSLVGTPPVSIANPVETKPSGTQDVRVTNPPERPSITNHIVVHMQAGAAPADVAQEIANRVSQASNGAFSDGGM